MSASDDELLARAARGDLDAVAQLLKRHGPRIRRTLRIGRQWQAKFSADDVMQVTYLDTLMRAAGSLPDTGASFHRWLKRVAQNNLRDAIKELSRDKRPPPHKRIESPPADESYAVLLEHLYATSKTPSRTVARGEAKNALEDAIKKLPADYATVVRLYDLEGRSGLDVASMMGRSRGAVVMLRARAHDRLFELLGSGSKFFSDSG